MRYRIYFKQKGESEETLFFDTMSGDRSMLLTKAELTLELSKAGMLEFEMLPDHPYYDSFRHISTYVRVVYNDDEELFRGRVLEIEDTIYKERTIKCEGDLAYLIDSLQPPDKTSSKDPDENQDITGDNTSQRGSLPADLRPQMPEESYSIAQVNLAHEYSKHETVYNHFCRYITNHNVQVDEEKRFQVGLVTVDERDVVEDFASTAWRDTKQAFDNDLLRYYSGYLQTRADPNGGYPFIDYLKEPINTVSQPIRLGFNMVDLRNRIEGSDIFSVFVPFGKNDLTIASIYDGSIGIEIPGAVSRYGYIFKTESYNNVTDPYELLRLGLAYIAANYKPNPLTISAKAIDMNIIDGSIERLSIGSKVNVVSSAHGLNITLACTKIDYNFLNPEDTAYEIGDPKETMSQKSALDKSNEAEEIAESKRTGSYAYGASLDLQAAVNRHAATIADQADTLYSLQAQTISINATTVRLRADLVEITTRALNITASSVEVTADKIHMGGVTIEPQGEFDVAVNGAFYANTGYFSSTRLDTDGSYSFQSGVTSPSYMTATTVFSHDFLVYTANGNNSLTNAIISFGTPTTSGNQVTIPYTTANGSTGNLTFSKTASLDGEWSSGIYKVTASDDTSNPKTVLLQTQLYGLNKVTGSETVSGTDVTAQAEVMYYYPSGQSVYNWAGTGYVGYITVDASTVRSNALAAVQMQKGTWSNGVLSVGNDANNRTSMIQLTSSTTWSGTTASVSIWDGQAANPQSGSDTGYAVSVNASGVVAAALADVTLTKGGWSNKQVTISNSANNRTKSVQLVAGNTSWNGNDATVPIWDGTAADAQHGVPTGLSVEVDASSRFNAGGATAWLYYADDQTGHGPNPQGTLTGGQYITVAYRNSAGNVVKLSPTWLVPPSPSSVVVSSITAESIGDPPRSDGDKNGNPFTVTLSNGNTGTGVITLNPGSWDGDGYIPVNSYLGDSSTGTRMNRIWLRSGSPRASIGNLDTIEPSADGGVLFTARSTDRGYRLLTVTCNNRRYTYKIRFTA